jgi:hypothetical protein
VFGLPQSTVCLIKSKIEPLVDHALMFTGIPLGEAATTRPVVVDGTYVEAYYKLGWVLPEQRPDE